MKLILKREPSLNGATIGQLLIDGVFFCYTLEDVVRPDGVKIQGETAIPAGVYQVVITKSNRFKRLMPLVKNVKGFDGIRIHKGNVAADTEGCILVGRYAGTAKIWDCSEVFNTLYEKLSLELLSGNPVTLTIIEPS